MVLLMLYTRILLPTILIWESPPKSGVDTLSRIPEVWDKGSWRTLGLGGNLSIAQTYPNSDHLTFFSSHTWLFIQLPKQHPVMSRIGSFPWVCPMKKVDVFGHLSIFCFPFILLPLCTKSHLLHSW
jgi:hypothetical protein